MKPRLHEGTGRRSAGFTLVEIMVSTTLCMLVMGGALSVFTICLRTMYRDMQRLATDAALRSLTTQVAKETLDSTEFYVFPDYRLLDGSVNLATDVSMLSPDDGVFQAVGDCLVLVTKVSTLATANIRQFRIYYRVTPGATHNMDAQAPIRYYESVDYGLASTQASLPILLNAVNLKTTPSITRSREVVKNTRGRLRSPVPASAPFCYPIFSTESATPTATNDSVSINVEIINGTTAANLLSSSSFHYTISPRK